MRRRILIFWFLVSMGLGGVVQSDELPRPKCAGVFGLCGYEDLTGVWLTPIKFEKARTFHFGLAAVRIEGQWGFIDTSGSLVIPAQFKAVGDFHESHAEAATDEGVGVLDRTGRFVIPPKFDRAIPFNDQTALVQERKKPKGPWVEKRLDSNFLLKTYRLFHATKGWLTEGEHKFSWFRRPRDGGTSLIWASETRFGSRYGLMRANGTWVVAPRFKHVQTLHEGLAVVSEENWGAVNATGDIVIPLEFHWLSFFENGYALTGSDDPYQSRKHGLISADGEVVAEPIYDKAERPTTLGGVPRVQQNGIWYRVESGELFLDGAGDGDVVASCPQGLRVIRRGKGYEVTDAAGNSSLSRLADDIAFGVSDDDGSISVAALNSQKLDCSAPITVVFGSYEERNTRSTFVGADGQPLLEEGQLFTSSYRFHMGYAVVETVGDLGQKLWGIINVDGAFTYGPVPEQILPNGRVSKLVGRPVFRLNRGHTTMLVDQYGITLPDVEQVLVDKTRQSAIACLGGARVTYENGKFGIVRENGDILVEPVHRAISCFRSGVAWAPNPDVGRWCPIGTSGQFREEPDCLEVFYPVRVSHHYPEQFSDDPFENSVLWVRAGLLYGFGLRKEPPKWIGDGFQSKVSHSVVPFMP